jgi:DNA repair exonuclease SbcCD ATPase subunit
MRTEEQLSTKLNKLTAKHEKLHDELEDVDAQLEAIKEELHVVRTLTIKTKCGVCGKKMMVHTLPGPNQVLTCGDCMQREMNEARSRQWELSEQV